jgi:alpha-galactosidase
MQKTLIATACLFLTFISHAAASEPTVQERDLVQKCFAAGFGDGEKLLPARPPFSFVYDGKPSAELLKSWKLNQSTKKLDENRTERTLVYSDPQTGLELRCVAVEYGDFPTVEWTLYFKNAGDKDTPIISDIQAIDVELTRDATGEFTLHRTVGDGVGGMYSPDPIALGPGQERKIAPFGGRPSSNEFPYFNVEMPGGGAIVAIGWPG